MEKHRARATASRARRASWCLLLATLASPRVAAQETSRAVSDRDAVVAAARELMAAQTYCALITIDEDGRPQVRTMTRSRPKRT